MATESLGAIAEIVMGQSPAGETCNVSGDGLPLLNGPTEFGPHHPTPVQYTTDTRKRARPGDILFCVRGSTTGRMNWADREYAIGRGIAAIRHKRGQDFRQFVRALIDYRLPELLAQATGSTFPNVSGDQLASMRCDVADENTQRAIATVLGALDDKIELNRQMNETLEALAQSLFKSRFVDVTQSALPKGWRECTLGDVIEVKHGFAYQGEFFRDEPCRDILLTPGNFAIGGGFKEDKFKYYEGPTPGEYILSEGDLLITMTDLSKAGDTLGYGALLPAPPEGQRFHHNQRLGKVLIRDSDVINKPFLYQILRTHEYRAEILGGATGTTVKHTSPGRIKSFKFGLPPESLMQEFGTVAGAWHELVALNRKESRTVAALRDALLPKLLSGELRVSAAATVIEGRL
jgi:type I restriction enzyme, S subunit